MTATSPNRWSIASAVVIAALSAPVCTQQATFRSSVDLIAVDVQVLDKSGAPITALASDRFDVTINGAKRRVVSADLLAMSGATSAGRDRPIVVGPVATNAWPAEGEGRTFVLAIDGAGLEPGAWQRTLLAARAFLARLESNDRVGLFVYPFGPTVSPTTERATIARALTATTVVGQTLRTTFHLTPSEIIDISAESARTTSPATAVRRTTTGSLDVGSDAPTVRRVQDRECPNDPNCSARILMDADNAASRLQARASQGLAGLESLLDVLSGVQGRKIVVLISGGMAVSDVPGGRPEAGDVARSLGEQLAHANAVIYTLHVDGSMRSMFAASQQRISLATVDVGREAALMGRWLEQFSQASGGILLRVQTDDGEAALQRVLRENSSYYLLGVEPAPGDRDGRLRALKVTVGQRGATVRYRKWVVVPKRAPV